MTTHWRPDELRRALLELADLMQERMKERNITAKMLEETGLVSARTLHRWFVEGRVPRWPSQVELMLKAAEATGVPRYESESLLPEAVKLAAITSVPESLSTEELILEQLLANGKLLAEIRDLLGVQLNNFESHRS